MCYIDTVWSYLIFIKLRPNSNWCPSWKIVQLCIQYSFLSTEIVVNKFYVRFYLAQTKNTSVWKHKSGSTRLETQIEFENTKSGNTSLEVIWKQNVVWKHKSGNIKLNALCWKHKPVNISLETYDWKLKFGNTRLEIQVWKHKSI